MSFSDGVDIPILMLISLPFSSGVVTSDIDNVGAVSSSVMVKIDE